MRVVSFGLGPIGCEIARVAALRDGIEIVGAVDIDPEKVGKSLGEVAGCDSSVAIVSSLSEAMDRVGRDADALLHSTASSLVAVKEQVIVAVDAGLSIVSTCEELSYPWRTQPGLAAELDQHAKAHDVRVLGTGVNPGFVMDALPLTLTAACQQVERIEVNRILDAGGRRIPLQRKVGAGLSVEEFNGLVRSGKVRHVGLTESAWLILDTLGMEADEISESIEPVIAEREIRTGIGIVKKGTVAGVRQTLRATWHGAERLRMDLRMYVGAEKPVDSARIYGVPDLEFAVNGGVHGDRATAAMVVNSVLAMDGLPAGLLSMPQLLRVHATGASKIRI